MLRLPGALARTLEPWLFIAAALSFLGGCNSVIFRSAAIPEKPNLVSVDAKQRVILSNPATVTTTTTTTKAAEKPDAGTSATGGQASLLTEETRIVERDALRFCAEPSPDVFTAIASSFGAKGSFGQSAMDVNAAAEIASTFSENAATIERTQTINILREVMYRNCERFLSGAISKEEFIVQAARDQQLIVQVLAVEQITGVAKAQSTALVTLSKASASGITDTGLTALAGAKADRDTKRTASQKASAEAAALPPKGACGPDIDTAQLPAGVTADEAKAKNEKCGAAKSAAALLKEADEYFASIQRAVDQQTDVSSEARGRLVSAAQSASEASEEIANVVLSIVRQYQSFDEIGMTCVVQMRSGKDLKPYCEELLKQMAETRQAQLGIVSEGLDPEQVREFRDSRARIIDTQANLVWKKLKNSFSAQALDELIANAGIKRMNKTVRKSLLDANRSLGEFTKAFQALPIDQKKALAKAAEL